MSSNPYGNYAKPFFAIGGPPSFQSPSSTKYTTLYGKEVRIGPQGKSQRLGAASDIIKKAKKEGFTTNLNTGFSKNTLFSAANQAQQFLNKLEEKKEKAKLIGDVVGITLKKGETGYFQIGTEIKHSKVYGAKAIHGTTKAYESPVYGQRPPQNDLERVQLIEKKFADQFNKDKTTLKELGVDISEDQYLYKPNQKEIKSLVSLAEEIKVKKPKWKQKGPEQLGDIKKLSVNELLEKREKIYQQQQQRIAELEGMGKADQYIGFELDMPLYKEKADLIDTRIGAVEKDIGKISKTYTPEKMKDFDFSGKKGTDVLFGLVEERDKIPKLHEQKIAEIQQIEDPALRTVRLEKDLPQYQLTADELEKKIEQYLNLRETRKDVGVEIDDQQTRRGRAPSYFKIKIGGEEKKFRTGRRGSMEAEKFFTEASSKQYEKLGKLSDPIERAVAEEQDLEQLQMGADIIKYRKKQARHSQRQELESTNIGAIGDSGPDQPSDSPTGMLKVPEPRQDFFRAPTPRDYEYGGGGRMDDGFDIGKFYGGPSFKIKKKQSDYYDLF